MTSCSKTRETAEKQCSKNITMMSLESLNTQLSVIMNDFTKAVITQIKSSSTGEQQVNKTTLL